MQSGDNLTIQWCGILDYDSTVPAIAELTTAPNPIPIGFDWYYIKNLCNCK